MLNLRKEIDRIIKEADKKQLEYQKIRDNDYHYKCEYFEAMDVETDYYLEQGKIDACYEILRLINNPEPTAKG